MNISEAEVEAAMRAFFGLGPGDRFTALEYVEFKKTMRAALTAAAQVRERAERRPLRDEAFDALIKLAQGIRPDLPADLSNHVVTISMSAECCDVSARSCPIPAEPDQGEDMLGMRKGEG